ncbi:MAG: UDP-N-acetylmuramoyl-L-alanine--D-glutamate ligase [Zetaproteobacteria bacterium]|nr:UDP-N-acetylmuramoyl-L-alanine--D-glutamate ligase [Zetaproteobacteria bacterium]
MKTEHIAIIGMGATGLSLTRFLTAQGHRCEGFDERMPNRPETISTPLHLGPLTLDSLHDFDRILLSPGIPWMHPVLVELRDQGAIMHGDLDLFLHHYHGALLTVTGTNGKTTATHMIAQLLSTLTGGIEAGGNIGTPMLDLMEKSPQRVVLELSSFQLERSQNIHPQWAVLLNIQPDHADMHATPAIYEAAKVSMFARQGYGDRALLPNECHWDALADQLVRRGACVLRFGHASEDGENQLACGIAPHRGAMHLFWSHAGEKKWLACDQLCINGAHQHINLAVAAQAAADFGVDSTIINAQLTSFKGLPHRLQHVAHVRHRDWYDDSKATNPDAALAALRSFPQSLWICGGLRKGLALDALIPTVRNHVAHAFIIGLEPEAYATMLTEAGVSYTLSHTLAQAVIDAANLNKPLPVLLSPAAASQDQFKNYAERGQQFTAAVRQLTP